jgi:hypothetical protein
MRFSAFAIDHARLEEMRAAFHVVCRTLECETEDPETERVVMKISGLARSGVTGADELTRLVLQDFDARGSGLRIV